MSDADRIKVSYLKENGFANPPTAQAAQGALTIAVNPIGEAKAQNVLLIATMPTDADTVTIDGKVYTFQTALTDFDGNVAIGGSLAQAQLNLENAVDLAGGIPGTDYALSMTAHPTVDIDAFGALVVNEAVVRAQTAGTAGNSIATVSSLTAGGDGFSTATLLGGTTADTMTINAKVYTFKNTLDNLIDGEIKIGATVTDTQNNTAAAINLTGVAGTQYSTATTINPDVSTTSFVANVATLTDKNNLGTAGNAIPLSETFFDAGNFFDAVTLGNVTLGTDIQMKEIRLTSESLIQSTDTTASAELRDDRQLSDLIRTNIQAEGDINTELSYESHEEFIEGGLFSDPFDTAVIVSGSTYFMLDSDNSLNDESNGLVTAGLVVGKWINTKDWVNVENNGFFKLISVTPGKAVLRGFTDVVDEQDTGVQAQGTLTMPVQPTASTESQGTLTLDTIPTDGDTMTIGSKTYTFKDTLTNVDGNIENAITLAQCKVNIENAVNLTGTPGVGYAAAMTVNGQASIASFIVDDAILTSKLPGTLGDSVSTTQTFTAGTNVFDAVTLGTTTAGVDGDTITIDAKTYQYVSDASILNFDGAIDVGASAADAQNNTVAAINLTGTPGTDYSLATTEHPTTGAGAFATDDSIITADLAGVGGNSIVTTSVFVSGSNFFDAATLGTTTAGSGNSDTTTFEQLSEVTNGVTTSFFSIEKEFTDVPGAFNLYQGMVVSTMSLEIAAGAVATGSFSFIGKNEQSNIVSLGTVDALELSTNPVMTGIEDTNAILENGVLFAATQLSLAVENNLRARPLIGVLGADSIGAGVVTITGTLQSYFNNIGIIQRYLDFETSSIAFLATDAGGNVYVYDLPKVKYSSGQKVAGGQNSDIIADMEFTAVRCPSEDITLRVAKFTGPGIVGDC